MKRILVLGSTGRVGRLLRLAWAKRPPEGVELILQSRDETGVRWQPGQPVPFGQVDAVIALWGVTQGDANQLEMNKELAIEAQRVGAECGADRVLHCSSVAVYAPKDGPLKETDATVPGNPYGQAKLAMEHALRDASGPQAVCLRIGSVVGAESLAASMRRGWDGAQDVLTLDRFADGKGPARSYIAPSHLARVLLGLATADQLPTVINVGAPSPVHMEAILQAANHPMQWCKARAGARQYAAMDCSRLGALVPPGAQASDPAYMVRDWLSLEGRA
jgi:nucleoside-diphosphate-sugar epimerase